MIYLTIIIGTPYNGAVFHLEIKFPQTYPTMPPQVYLYNTVHRTHVYGNWICLNILWDPTWYNEPYQGWSSCYTLNSVLLQLQSYLFDKDGREEHESYFKADSSAVFRCILAANNYKCFVCPHDTSKNKPWPMTPEMMLQYAPAVNTKPKNAAKYEEVNMGLGMKWYFPKFEEEPQSKKLIEVAPKKVSNGGLAGLSHDLWIHGIFNYLNLLEVKRFLFVNRQFRAYALECSSLYQMDSYPLQCFHTKDFAKDVVLGVGINVQRNPYDDNIIAYINTPLDLLSEYAFKELNVRTSAWKEPFTHWLPMYLNKEHGDRAFPVFMNCIMELSNEKIFNAISAVNILCKLMNTMVVNIMNGHKHASIKGLTGYSYFHRWLIYLVNRIPRLQQWIDERVEDFIKHERSRDKEEIPMIGDFIPLLSVSKFTWKQFASPLLKEVFTRNVLWLLKKYPIANYQITDKTRLQCSFDSSQVMNKLIMFHYTFLNMMARPSGKSLAEVAASYDAKNGQPSFLLQEAFQQEVFKITNIKDFEGFFETIQIESKNDTVSLLLGSIARSISYGYHFPPRYVETLEEVREKQLKFQRLKSFGKSDDWTPWTNRKESNKVVHTVALLNPSNQLIPCIPWLGMRSKRKIVRKPKPEAKEEAKKKQADAKKKKQKQQSDDEDEDDE